MSRKKKTSHLLKFVYGVCGIVGLVLAAFIYVFCIMSRVQTNTTFIVGRGASVSAVAGRLESHNMIPGADMFKFCVRMQGGKIQSGEYEIPAGASMWRIADMLANGRIATTTVVIPEGLTVQQIKELLLAASNLTGGVDCDGDLSRPVCNLRDGDVFPDTYFVAKGTTRLAVLELARKKMTDIHDAWARAGHFAPEPLKSWNDIVTLASIVQKETPRESEMPVVASVYLNRLNKKMRLQADPTVVYALTNGYGDMQGAALLRGHLKTDSPYNTYMHYGLPPAPIANVGQAAIRAVLKPADTNFLFFVADGQGGHRFAKSYEEHQKNHADWRAIKKIKNKN